MSDRGVFAIDRGIFDHPMFAPEPFTEVQAWIWMLSAAAWTDKRVRVGKAVLDLERGQLAFATRFLAVKWQWTDSRVRRFLKRLETDAMVIVLATREATQVTICNYDQYQFGRRTDDAQSDAQNDARATHERRKEEELKKDNNQEVSKKRAREPSSDFEFEDFWNVWPNKVGKPAALRAFVAARKRANLDDIVNGVLVYIREKPPDRQWLNPATFLNQDRWKDQPAKVANVQKPSGFDEAYDRVLARLNAGFAGAAPEERVCPEPGETDARLLPFRRSQ